MFEAWVRRGAPDPRTGNERLGGMDQQTAQSWWAFQPIKPSAEPLTSAKIDQYLLDAMSVKGLATKDQAAKFSESADRRTLIRRATYDLTGLPPTPAEVDAFVNDPASDAFTRLIDRLLDSPQYGVQWGRHWLDVVRYADTAGENTDRPLPHAWRYRNWVFDAVQRDLPYDEFVRLQIAGDLLKQSAVENERIEGIIATGYLAIARRFGHDINKDIYLTYEDVIDNLGKNFLGLSLGCARCHDHKYDPINAQDYYALYGILQSTRFPFPGCEPVGQPRDMVPLIDQREVDRLQADYQQRLAEYEERAQVAPREGERLKKLIASASMAIAESIVGEGQSVDLQTKDGKPLESMALHKGEVLQLTVSPNGNYGADTTRIQWRMTRQDSQPATWDVESLIGHFNEAAPAFSDRGATWCVLEVTNGPVLLKEKNSNVSGNDKLYGWANGGVPSSLVNAGDAPAEVWTKLPPHAVFIHPGEQRQVAIAWICPEDGIYQVTGTVTDAHPAGLDGVAYRLDHITDPEVGAGLIGLVKAFTDSPPKKPDPPIYPVAYAVAEAAAKDAELHLRGDPEQLGEVVPRRWLTVFGGEPVPASVGSGRESLANWISRHPLAARVMVNRVWGWHFGRGLVTTPNDFGARGEPPTHPELLEHLAHQFVADGYQLKPLHRLIMLSQAYQQASEIGSPDPRYKGLLTSFSRRRLTAEELRDSLLLVSHDLDDTRDSAHPFPPESTWTFTQHNPFNAVYESRHRSAFLMVQRQRRHPFLALFDGADPNASTPQRSITTVPTQALYFINDPFFHAQSQKLAARVLEMNDDRQRLLAAYAAVYQRAPTESERDRWQRFMQAYPAPAAEQWAAWFRVMLSANEFIYVD